MSSISVLDARAVEASHTWIINGFSLLNSKVNAPVYSNEFELHDNKFKVKLHPGGNTEENKDHLSLFLSNCSKFPFTASFRFEIVGADGSVKLTRASTADQKFEGRLENSVLGFKQFAAREAVLDPRKGLLDGDTLRIRVTVIKVAIDSAPSRTTQTDHLKALSGDLAKALDAGTHSDVTLVVDGTEIPAHRVILSARSQFFAACFAHEMKEKQEGVVRFDDIALPVFRQLLRFIYTGSCDFSASVKEKEREGKEGKESKESKGKKKSGKDEKENESESETANDMAKALLSAADRFQLTDLQLLCSAKLAESINTNNAAELLMLADACHASDLKKRVLEFIRSDSKRAAAVMDTDASQKLSPALLHEIIGALVPSNSKKRPRDESSGSSSSAGAGAGSGGELSKGAVKKLKVSELRAELEGRGLETSGLKAELVERLENALAS